MLRFSNPNTVFTGQPYPVVRENRIYQCEARINGWKLCSAGETPEKARENCLDAILRHVTGWKPTAAREAFRDLKEELVRQIAICCPFEKENEIFHEINHQVILLGLEKMAEILGHNRCPQHQLREAFLVLAAIALRAILDLGLNKGEQP